MLFKLINFIAFEYNEKNFFHGDIKPENIFYYNDEFSISMTTDIGTLLYLGEGNQSSLFIRTCYTEKYASPKYIEAVKNKIPFTKAQLLNEDKY